MLPNKQNSKNTIADTEESTLVLGEPNITVKVCISLKRLLIVTFNIKAIRIQSSKCSHPVKLSFGGIRSLRFIIQPNLYVFKKTLVVRNDFVKTFVSHFPCHHFVCFSDITLIVIPSASKMVGGVTYILFTAWLTAQQVNQTFIVAIKTMVYFIGFFSGEASKFLSNTYALTDLTPRTTAPSAPYLSFNRI